MTENFGARIAAVDPACGKFLELQTLQVNLGDLCNLSCTHCHVGGSAAGKRVMERAVMKRVAEVLRLYPDVTLDITGGCPEMNPDFRFLVEETAGGTRKRMLRSNLAIMTEEGMEWL